VGVSEAQNGMELDPLGSDAGLTVEEIEEADSRDRRLTSQLRERARGQMAAGPE
jgi:hypothetical protein